MRKMFVMVILLYIPIVVLSGCSADEEASLDKSEPDQPKPAGYTDVDVIEAMNLIDTVSNLVTIDVSPLFAEGHLPGAVNYRMVDGILEKVLPILNPGLPYLIYCHSDSVSTAAAQLMIDSGFETVYRLKGNYDAWAGAGHPVETGAGSQMMADWWPDGLLDEYGNTVPVNDDYQISWDSDDRFIYMGLKASTDGWVSIGFEPSSRMKDADMIFGYVTDGEATVVDMFSTGPLGPHPVDTRQGGTDDIIAFGGSEDENYTVIEFKRKRITGDSYDQELAAGLIDIIWAYGSSDNLTQRHASRGSGEINLE